MISRAISWSVKPLKYLGILSVDFNCEAQIFIKNQKMYTFSIFLFITLATMLIAIMSKLTKIYLINADTNCFYYSIYAIVFVMLLFEIYKKIFKSYEILDILNKSYQIYMDSKMLANESESRYIQHTAIGLIKITYLDAICIPVLFVYMNSAYFNSNANVLIIISTTTALIIYVWVNCLVIPLIIIFWIIENSIMMIKDKFSHITNNLKVELKPSEIGEKCDEINKISVILSNISKIIERTTRFYACNIISTFFLEMYFCAWMIFSIIWLIIYMIDSNVVFTGWQKYLLAINIIITINRFLAIVRQTSALKIAQKKCINAINEMLLIPKMNYRLRMSVIYFNLIQNNIIKCSTFFRLICYHIKCCMNILKLIPGECLKLTKV